MPVPNDPLRATDHPSPLRPPAVSRDHSPTTSPRPAPASPGQAVKRVKRNPLVAGAVGAVLLVLLAAVLSIDFAVEASSQGKVARDNVEKAEAQEKEALHQKGVAEKWEREARVAQDRAEVAQHKAEFAAYASRLREAQSAIGRARLPEA